MPAERPHTECSRDDNCGAADCPWRQAELRREEGRRGRWSAIGGPDRNGYRTLDGHPLSCGTVIELQKIRIEDDDSGSYAVYLQEGQRVRYELDYKTPVIYAHMGGYNFSTEVEPGMRFRWPLREGR